MELSRITQEDGETVDNFFKRLQTMAHRTGLQDEKQTMQYLQEDIQTLIQWNLVIPRKLGP